MRKKKNFDPVRGVHTTNRYGYWHELLQQWVFLVERVHRLTKGQHAVYAYKERTNVGLLASAATANGWIALEECSSEKHVTTAKDHVYQGRSDIRIWRDKRHHEIEAKFLRVALTSSSNSRLEAASARAISDASRSIKNGSRDRKIAVTFVAPMLTKTQCESLSPAEKHEYMEKLLQYISEQKPSFIAYAFPGEVEAVGSMRKSLGIILFGAEPKPDQDCD